MVYMLSGGGTLHTAIKTDQGLRTYEADNLDQAPKVYWSDLREVPASLIKRYCARCFPNGEKP